MAIWRRISLLHRYKLCPRLLSPPLYLGLKWSRADMDADPLAFVDFSSGREFLLQTLNPKNVGVGCWG